LTPGKQTLEALTPPRSQHASCVAVHQTGRTPADGGVLYGLSRRAPTQPRQIPLGYPGAKKHDCRPPKGSAKSLPMLREVGAGEGARTLDPDLGKVTLLPVEPRSHVRDRRGNVQLSWMAPLGKLGASGSGFLANPVKHQ